MKADSAWRSPTSGRQPGRDGRAGQGMVITQADRKPVKSTADLRKALEARPLSEGLMLMVRTEEGSRMVMIRVGG